MLIAPVVNSCSDGNDKKNHFIQKNIQKINNKNIQKHGKLIIPDLLLEIQNEKTIK